MSKPPELPGDRPPRIVTPPPGPRSRQLSRRLAALEAPGVNTLYGGADAIVWRAARGANVLDVDGNRYLDLTAGFGVAAVGHRHPAVVAAVERQSRTLLHGLGDVAAHPARIELAQRLVELAPVPEAQVYFAVSGSDAVEVAIKSALLATGRRRIVAFEPSYHGLTLGALAATARPWFRQPFADQLNRHVTRLPYGASRERLAAAIAGGPNTERAGTEGARTEGARTEGARTEGARTEGARTEGAGTEGAGTEGVAAAVVVEPVVGREGVIVPPAGWLAALADECRRHGALLIADEIFTGFGRTGSLFASAAEGITPDLLCVGKALAGGMPLAAVIGRRRVLAAWGSEGEARHTATFLAHPPACAAALAVLDLLAADDLPGRARRLGEALAPRLARWPGRFAPLVTAVRGRGLLWGVEMADRHAAGRLVAAAGRRGVLLLAGGADGRVVQLCPPLTIAERLLSTAVELIAEALAEGAGAAR